LGNHGYILAPSPPLQKPNSEENYCSGHSSGGTGAFLLSCPK
jgi:hypothetical protein